jgi:L-threonylcarbamoyladenylate synthase
VARLPDIRRVRAWLKRGGVVAYATESCFGLGCDPRNARAVRRILALKGRPQAKGLILIGSDFHQFARFLAPLPSALASRFPAWWPGPNSLLLPISRRCPRWLTGHHAKLAVRVTAHADAARLCRALDMALVSTSANRAGRRPMKTAGACRMAFGRAVLVLPSRVGGRRFPSRILDPLSGSVLRA